MSNRYRNNNGSNNRNQEKKKSGGGLLSSFLGMVDTSEPSTPVQESQPPSSYFPPGPGNGVPHVPYEDPTLRREASTRSLAQKADTKNQNGADLSSQQDSSSQRRDLPLQTPQTAAPATGAGSSEGQSFRANQQGNSSTPTGQATKPVEPASASASAPQASNTSNPKASVISPASTTTTPNTQPAVPDKKGTAHSETPIIESSSASNVNTTSTSSNNVKRDSSPPPTHQNGSSSATSNHQSSQLPNGSGPVGVNTTSSATSNSRALPQTPTTPNNPKTPAVPNNSQNRPAALEVDTGRSQHDTPLIKETNPASSSPAPTRRLLVMHDTVKRATTIDWYIRLPVDSNGIPQEFETSTPLSSGDAGSGKVLWKTDVSNPEEPLSTITIDCPAHVNLRVYSTTTSSSAIIDRYVDGYKEDAPSATIPWHDLKGLVGANNILELLVSIVLNDAKEPLPSDPVITETCSPASIEALGGFLDQPGGHDVVFQFPGRNNYLYGDRYMLQRSSAYFRARLQVSGDEPPVLPPSRKKLDDDSDDEIEGDDHEDKVGMDSSAPNSKNNSPHGTWRKGRSYSSSSVTESRIDFHGIPAFRLEPMPQYPPYNVGVSVTQTNEISFRTFRAVLYYVYTGYIAFAPITSNLTLPEDSNLNAVELHEKRRLLREQMVKAYMKRYPNRPEPASPKSVYVAARKYGLPSLEAQALARIKVAMPPTVTVTELFSPFTRAYPEIRDYHLERAVAVWSQIQKTREWTNVRKEAKEKPDAYFTELLFDIIDRFPRSA